MSSVDIKPIIPKTGQLLLEDVKELLLCKPRLMPLKSYTLEKLENMQQAAQKLKEEINEQEQQKE